MPPTLATDRLSLEPHRPDDLTEMAALNADPAIAAQIGNAPSTREQSWHRLLRYIGHWSTVGYGHWVVRDAGSRAYLGEVGLMDSRRATGPAFEGVPEAGWVFATTAHGRGFAGEACEAMLAWADARGIARTMCMIAPGNAASLRLAARLGYGRAVDGRYAGKPVVLLERMAPG